VPSVRQAASKQVATSIGSVSVPSPAKIRAGTTLGTLRDTKLTLYSTSGTTVLASNDDAGGTLASRIDWTAPLAGVYYVQVSAYNTSQTGTYTLSVSTGTGTGTGPIYGSPGPDFIGGGEGGDLIYGGDGNDTIYGGSGNDTVYGGNGHDIIYGPEMTISTVATAMM
jgi:Ca2+-binding RTX toxin-like protein